MSEDQEQAATPPIGEPDAVQPAQDAGVAPVPAPGHRDSSAGPGVRTAQGGPQDGRPAADEEPGSDAPGSSPGAWTAVAAPGKPDGEPDTRA